MKTYDLYKLAANKILDGNYCVLSIKSTGVSKNDEIIEVGVVDKNEDVILDKKFRPAGMADETGPTELFKNEFVEMVRVLTKYDSIVLFNENLVRRLFVNTVEKYELSVRHVDRLFKNVFDLQVLYDAYIGSTNTKLDIACDVEGVDTKNITDAISICEVMNELLKTIASEYTHPNRDGYMEKVIDVAKQKREAAKKERKANARKSSNPIDMYKEGKTVEEIAKIRGVRTDTIYTKLIDAFLYNELENIDTLIQMEYYDKIIELYTSVGWDGTLKSIKELLPDDCTMNSIKAAIAKHKKAEGFVPESKDTPLTESYAKLYNLGKSLTEIAREKGVQIYTASSNVIKAYEEGLIENIDDMIQSEYVQDILEKIKEADWDGKLKSIKEKLDEKCSYETIKAVIAKNKKGCYNKEESSSDVPDSSNSIPQEPSDIETPNE